VRSKGESAFIDNIQERQITAFLNNKEGIDSKEIVVADPNYYVGSL
jgi:hypothetical protein